MINELKIGPTNVLVYYSYKWLFVKPLVKSIPLCLFLFLIYFFTYHLEESENNIWFFAKMGLFDSFCVAYIVGLLPYRLSKFVRWGILIFCSIVAVSELFTCHFFGTQLSPSILQLVLDTNGGETKEFFSAYCNNYFTFFLLLGWILFLALYFVCDNYFNCLLDSIKAVVDRCKLSRYLRKIQLCLILLLFTFVVFCGYSCKEARPLQYQYLTADFEEEKELIQTGSKFVMNNYRPLYRFAYSLHWNIIMRNFSKDALKTIKDCKIYNCKYTSPTIVLIIGESHARKHSSLYGYAKDTTPFQKQMEVQGNLTAFTDVVTPYNITADIIPLIFSLNNIDDKGYWSDSVFFPYILKKSGYNVSFITNQFSKYSDENLFDFSGGGFLNLNSISKSLFTFRNQNKHQYDEGLLVDYDSIRNNIDKSKYNFVIFHLMGQHVFYSQRYPKNRTLFTVNDYKDRKLDSKAKQIVAEYDNAMLYNDYVISQIVSRFIDKESVILYLPDHGESVYDGINSFGRHHDLNPNRDILDNEFHISFWIWASDKYIEKHPDIIVRIKAAKDRPYMSDDIAHTLLDLAGINCTDYDSSRSIISVDNKKQRKRMIKGNIDYDNVFMNNSIRK